MSRRSLEKTDSLDMLLDTMCNTFGGIILIALLISMLAHDAPTTAPVTDSPHKAEALRQDYTNVVLRNKQLQSDYSNSAPTVLVLNQIEVLRLKKDAQADMQKSAAELESKVKEAQKAKSELVTRLSNLNRHIQHAAEEVANVTNKNVVEIRAPIYTLVHGRENWDIVVKGGKLYPVNTLINGQLVANGALFTEIRPNEYVPIADKGIDARESSDAFSRILAPLSATRFVVRFHLYADSFSLFSRLRKTAIDKRFGYALVLYRDTATLKSGSGGDVGVEGGPGG